MHHIPHTGDLPNTLFTNAHAGIILEPLNYFESNPSRATKQQIKINGELDSAKIETFGADSANCSVDLVSNVHVFVERTLIGV